MVLGADCCIYSAMLCLLWLEIGYCLFVRVFIVSGLCCDTSYNIFARCIGVWINEWEYYSVFILEGSGFNGTTDSEIFKSTRENFNVRFGY